MTICSKRNEAEKPDIEMSTAKSVEPRAAHDVRASLLIVNGFNQVLASSFNDLLNAYHAVFKDHPHLLQGETATMLSELEADCGSCILQARRSIENLSKQLADHAESDADAGYEGRRDES